MRPRSDTFSRYLPVHPRSRQWGWHLLDAGRQQIAPHSPYPGAGHPDSYLFSASGRRTLSEFQIVFISSGKGTFSSRSVPECLIEAGDAFILFPGEWHCYRPLPESGWSEYWLGYKGLDADRVMAGFFSPAMPVRRSAHQDELVRLFDQLLHRMAHPFPGCEEVWASFVPMILAFLRTEMVDLESGHGSHQTLVSQARMHFLANLSGRTDLEALAHSLGTSYSTLRSVFKRETGFAPREYENLLKLNHSRDLLISGQFNVSEVAERLGYSSIYYFSRAFRKAFGVSPTRWMKRC